VRQDLLNPTPFPRPLSIITSWHKQFGVVKVLLMCRAYKISHVY